MDSNSINLGKIYGISGTCAGGPCEFTGNIVPNTPSLEQIASYNVRLRANQIPNAEVERKLRTLEEGIGESIITTIPDPYAPATYQDVPENNSNMSSPPQPMGMTDTAGTSPAGTGGNMALNNETSAIQEYNQPFPVTGESIQYLNGFMRTQIGRRIEIQMLVGSDNLVTKEGYLLGIGANFILINEVGTNDLTTCDFYNIKFVKYFY